MKTGEKTSLARQVGRDITREQFETEMPEMFAALGKAWECAHQ